VITDIKKNIYSFSHQLPRREQWPISKLFK